MTRNAATGDELALRLAAYRLDTRYVGTEELHLDVDAIADDSRWHEALAAACNRLADRGAVVVINGCSAVDLGDASVGPVVVDPTRLALALLAAGTAAGARSPPPRARPRPRPGQSPRRALQRLPPRLPSPPPAPPALQSLPRASANGEDASLECILRFVHCPLASPA